MEDNMKRGLKIAGAAAAGCCLGGFLHWSNKSIVTTEYTYASERLPEAFRGFRIVNVSDLQSQYFGRDQADLLGKVRAAEPDIIVITGDLLDRNHTDFRAAKAAVAGLVEIAPVYYINGNHEIVLQDEDIWEFYGELEELGMNILFDAVQKINKDGAEISLLGISEYTLFMAKESDWLENTAVDGEVIEDQLGDLCAERPEDEFTVLLVHEPQMFRYYARADIDLILCGHAHGGQFRLPGGQGLFSPGQGVLPRYTQGPFRKGGSTMIVSRGLGNSIFPFRLNNRPELVAVTLEKK
jgi:predicted MPP superfamily phosphohydrolase